MQTEFDALIVAGYDPDRSDLLTQTTGAPRKALVEIAGRPMVWHVVRALAESGVVRELVIVGMGPEDGVNFGRPVHYVPNQESLWANQKAGLDALRQLDAANRYVLGLTADVPLQTGEIVRWFVDACQPLDRQLYVGIVSREVMVAAFPNSRRSYLALREGCFCSADLFLGELDAAYHIQNAMRETLAHRKNALRQARVLGFRVLLKLLFRRMTMPELLAIAERYLGITGAPIIMPFAGAGMDVDKPHQLAQVIAYLQEHPEHPANARAGAARAAGTA